MGEREGEARRREGEGGRRIVRVEKFKGLGRWEEKRKESMRMRRAVTSGGAGARDESEGTQFQLSSERVPTTTVA